MSYNLPLNECRRHYWPLRLHAMSRMLRVAVVIVAAISLTRCRSSFPCEGIRKLRIGMTEAEVRQVLGSPASVSRGAGGPGPEILFDSTWNYDGRLGVGFYDGRMTLAYAVTQAMAGRRSDPLRNLADKALGIGAVHHEVVCAALNGDFEQGIDSAGAIRNLQSTICNIHVRDPDPLRSFRRTPDAAGSSRASRTCRGDGRGATRWRSGARRSSRRARRRASSSRACTTPTTSAGSPRPPGSASQLDPDTYTSPESHEIALLAAGAAVDARRARDGRVAHAARRDGAAAGASRRARSRDGLLPATTTSRSPRRTRARRAPRRSRSWTTTSITATARSTSSRPIRTSSTSRRTSSRTTRAPARRTRSGARRGTGSRSTCRSKSARWTRTISSRSRTRAAGAAAVRARSAARVGRLRRARARSARRHAPLDRARSRAMTLELRAVADECCRGRIVVGDRGRLRSAGAGRVARRGDRGACTPPRRRRGRERRRPRAAHSAWRAGRSSRRSGRSGSDWTVCSDDTLRPTHGLATGAQSVSDRW